MAYVAAGLLLSWLVVRETRGHAAHEMQGQGPVPGEAVLTHGEVFRRTSLTDPNLSSVS